ncbi:MAG: hypothetical protein ACR2HR_17460 [Euzebya sp.]
MMDLVLRTLFNGPVLLLGGIVLLIFGGAGLVSAQGASYSRLRTAKPIVFLLMLGVGVLLVVSGLTLILG